MSAFDAVFAFDFSCACAAPARASATAIATSVFISPPRWVIKLEHGGDAFNPAGPLLAAAWGYASRHASPKADFGAPRLRPRRRMQLVWRRRLVGGDACRPEALPPGEGRHTF